MASTSGVAEAATRSLFMSIRRGLIHRGSMYVKVGNRQERMDRIPSSLHAEIDGLRGDAFCQFVGYHDLEDVIVGGDLGVQLYAASRHQMSGVGLIAHLYDLRRARID